MSCPDCFKGFVQQGEAKGKITQIHGLETYVAQPPAGTQPKGIIVIVPDAFGLPFPNNKFLADNYAEKGQYLVYLPDFMDGNAAPIWMLESMSGVTDAKSWLGYLKIPYHLGWTLTSFLPFLYKNRFSISHPRITSFLSAIRANEASSGLGIGVAGFCWGGEHVVRLAQGEKTPDGKLLVDASFTAHPSNLSIPQDMALVTQPVSFALGTRDFVTPMSAAKKIEAALEEVEADSEVVYYEGAGHGFAVRADLAMEDVAAQAERAEGQALEWFGKQFAKLG